MGNFFALTKNDHTSNASNRSSKKQNNMKMAMASHFLFNSEEKKGFSNSVKHANDQNFKLSQALYEAFLGKEGDNFTDIFNGENDESEKSHSKE